ncbi:MAG: damage-control phosphatase ARMT1 family protein [Thermodesulfobacteriota bacterium]
MHTRLDCLPCFMRQALNGARLTSPNDLQTQKKILSAVAQSIARMDTRLSPPHLAGQIYAQITEISGTDDPFADYKKKSNSEVMALLPEIRSRILREEDRLFFALRMSIIGNYMDAGVARDFDWQSALKNEKDARWAELHYPDFKNKLKKENKILIIGDNAGEIALDTLLVRELVELGNDVTYAVRALPILNDATVEDARDVGMTDICEVISSGSDCPGSVTSRCTDEFLKKMHEADLVISKGQGNFEALSEEKNGIYFAFKVKCEVVAELVGLPIGSSIFRFI